MENIPVSSPVSPIRRPEENLQAIRDLTLRNEQILARLLEIEERRETRRKWGFFASFMMIVLPYLLTAFMVWYFYMKVEETVSSLKTSVESVVPKVPESWKEKAGDLKQKVLELGK
ncbi:MAG: hypothetical protein WCJ84_01690 [Candidatus Peregrinibacteria bacterium]